MKKLAISLLFVISFCVACGEDNTPTKTNDFSSLRLIQIFSEYPSVAKNTKNQMRAVGFYYDEPSQDITDQVVWASADTVVASISDSGLVSTHSVGQTTISATINGQQGRFDFIVADATPIFIDVIPSTMVVPNGTNLQYIAYGTFAGVTEQFVQDISNSVEWTSLAPEIATMTQSGLAVTTGTGTVEIEALLDGFDGVTVTGSAVLTVTSP